MKKEIAYLSNAKLPALLLLSYQIYFISLHRHICSCLSLFLLSIFSILSFHIFCVRTVFVIPVGFNALFIDSPNVPKFNFKANVFCCDHTSSCCSVIKSH